MFARSSIGRPDEATGWAGRRRADRWSANPVDVEAQRSLSCPDSAPSTYCRTDRRARPMIRDTARARIRLAASAGIVMLFVVAFPGTAYAALVADWEMDDVGSPPSTMVDSSGGGHDGQPSGGVVGDGSTYTFDGTGVVEIADPDGTTLNPDGQDIAITASISFSQRPSKDYDILRKKPAGVKGMQYRMEIMSTGKAKC